MLNIKNIAHKFQNNNKNLYIVGGFCRDKILCIQDSATDIDFTTDALPEETEKIVNCIAHVGKKYGTQIVYEDGKSYEITTFRSDIGILDNRKPVKVMFTTDLNLDTLRRDFTCNAVYFDPISEKYIDPVGGVNDLQKKIIRFVGNPEDRIQEDALRILRFIRFRNKYSLTPAENNYFEIIRNNIGLLKNISSERIKDELDKILLGKNNVQALKDLKNIGFFTVYLEELDKQSETPGNSYHLEGDVWTHTLMTIDYLNTLNLPSCRSHKLDLYWTMLLHDITKSLCYSRDDKGECHYYGHEKSGAEIFKNTITKQLPFSNRSIHRISWIIENHLRIFKIFEMKKIKSRKLMLHKYWGDLMLIGEADHMGRIPKNYDLIKKLHNFYQEFLTILKNKSFYTGQNIMIKYPHLKGIAIGNKLKELNDNILINDE